MDNTRQIPKRVGKCNENYKYLLQLPGDRANTPDENRFTSAGILYVQNRRKSGRGGYGARRMAMFFCENTIVFGKDAIGTAIFNRFRRTRRRRNRGKRTSVITEERKGMPKSDGYTDTSGKFYRIIRRRRRRGGCIMIVMGPVEFSRIYMQPDW